MVCLFSWLKLIAQIAHCSLHIARIVPTRIYSDNFTPLLNVVYGHLMPDMIIYLTKLQLL